MCICIVEGCIRGGVGGIMSPRGGSIVIECYWGGFRVVYHNLVNLTLYYVGVLWLGLVSTSTL